jgi:ResB-like family
MWAALSKTADMVMQAVGGSFPVPSAQAALAAPRVPVFPGGYLIGGLLLINLLAAHTRYYQPGRTKIGIVLIHAGVVLLLAGQFLTDFLSTESTMHIREGATANYSEAVRTYELAVIDTTDPGSEKVIAIPEGLLLKRRDISHPELPFTVRVKTFYANSSVTNAPAPGYTQVAGSAGDSGIWWQNLPRETSMDRRDMPSGLVELLTPQGPLGDYLVSSFLQPQTLAYNGRRYELQLRLERFYMPFSLYLIKFSHDRYAGTDIPKNFSSRVRLQRPDTGEDRTVNIYMNNPLRYAGKTFYQASYDPDDHGTILEVVHNPSWLTPYFSCVLVALGLMVQFSSHLFGFALQRRT